MDKVGRAVFCKELGHALGHHTAKAIDLADLLLGRLPDGFQRAEMFRQQSRSLIADVPDAKAKQQLVQIVFPGVRDGLQQIGRTLFLELFQRQQLLQREGVKVSRRVHQPLIHQLRCNRRTEAVDVHGIAGSKVDDIAECLCWALRVDTAQCRLIFQMHHRCAAGRADCGHLIGLCTFLMAGHTDDLRNDITRLAHLNGIPDAEAELMDEVLVVERRTRYGSPRQKDWVKAGRRGQNACAANGYFDAAQRRLLDLRRVLERNGPARKFVGRTHQIALCKSIYFDDGTVHIKIELRTVLADLLDLSNGVFDVVHHVIARRDRQAQALEVVQTLCMGGQFLAADLLHIEDKDRQPTAPGDF